MKQLILIMGTIFLMLSMTGCNTGDGNVPEEIDDLPLDEDEVGTRDEMTDSVDSPFHFTHFDLDVEYENDEEFDVEYENERDGMEAEIKDDLTNTYLSGDEAFEVLSPIFEQLTFDSDTPEEEVISEVLDAFNLQEDFHEFELEVRFHDGTKKEYERR